MEEGSLVEYDYYQEGRTSFLMDCEDDDSPKGMIFEGTLMIEGTGVETASFIMKDMRFTEMEVIDGKKVLGEEVAEPGLNESTGLKPNGKFENNPDADNLFDLLFSLPPADIQLGESIEKKISFPVNAYGNSTSLNAIKRIVYEKDTVINDHVCAVLRFNILDGALEKSVSFKKDTYGKYTGNGVSYFNLKEHVVEGAKGSVLIDIFIRLGGDNADCFGVVMDQSNQIWRK